MKHIKHIVAVLFTILSLSSCEKFFDPKQDTDINADELYNDWYEYRSVEMGLYALQQQLVEQLLVLGELRGDLLTITPNADADLVEVYNFKVSKTNKYASPLNFYKLISACNSLIRVLEEKHPEVKDKKVDVTNYDKLYGEVLCMRAWAYFNAARIYYKVPFIHESLETVDEVVDYVNSSGEYVDKVKIIYGKNGFDNDTIYNAEPVKLEKKYLTFEQVMDYFIDELETRVKAVGVNHYMDNSDNTWEVTIWSEWSYRALLGQMALTQGDLVKAFYYFDKIIKNNTTNLRYQLDKTFQFDNWANIFSSIDNREHIYTIKFAKSNFQQNSFQDLFEPFYPHKFMMKPTKAAVQNWESQWMGQVIARNAKPELTKMTDCGTPGDYYRGYFRSFALATAEGVLSRNQYLSSLYLRAKDDFRTAKMITAGYDTMVVKYSLNKDVYDQDANYIIYRAGGIHLYITEVFNYIYTYNENGKLSTFVNRAVALLNNAGMADSYYNPNDNTRAQLGVRGRVGLGFGDDIINIEDIIYKHDFYSNEIIGYTEMVQSLTAKQEWFEERILDERARELAYEGERFYDLMRMAQRRNDPSFLASRVSAKYPASKRQEMYELLKNPDNWYIHYFDAK